MFYISATCNQVVALTAFQIKIKIEFTHGLHNNIRKSGSWGNRGTEGAVHSPLEISSSVRQAEKWYEDQPYRNRFSV